jgi:hypothetical protein
MNVLVHIDYKYCNFNNSKPNKTNSRRNLKEIFFIILHRKHPTRGEKDYWGDSRVDGKIILGWIFRKWDVGVYTGLIWLRIETSDGHL